MKQLAMKTATFSSTAVLAFAISTGVMAQEKSESDKERAQLGNLYTQIITIEWCASLHMFFNDSDVESVKENSIKKTHEFKLSDAEKNEIWKKAVNSIEGVLFFMNLANYSEQFDYCSTVHNFYRVYSPVSDQKGGSSSERPF